MTPLPAYHRSRPTASRVRHGFVHPPKANSAPTSKSEQTDKVNTKPENKANG
ncbi:hypothetical protein [Plesiomonas sp.]|uniref:hypothetical protein n=1 Tax=Plesiomonas sp. TaxID=2486279 RepID=UPI003F35B291